MSETDVAGLVERMALQIEDWDEEEPRENWWRWQRDFAQAADALQSQAAEIARLRAALDATPTETADERQAAIVAWLRGETPSAYTDPQYDIGMKLADAIESGEWRRA